MTTKFLFNHFDGNYKLSSTPPTDDDYRDVEAGNCDILKLESVNGEVKISSAGVDITVEDLTEEEMEKAEEEGVEPEGKEVVEVEWTELTK